MRRLGFRARAIRDLNEIADFIARDSQRQAERFVAKIEAHRRLLTENPDIGRRRDELRPSVSSVAYGATSSSRRQMPNE